MTNDVLEECLNTHFNLYLCEINMLIDIVKLMWNDPKKLSALENIQIEITFDVDYLSKINKACVIYCGVDCNKYVEYLEWCAKYGY